MQLEILSIGKVKQSFVLSAEEEYLQRIRPFAKTKVTEIELPKLASLPDPERRRRETEEVLSRVKPGAFLIALDEDGKEFSSEDFAKFIDKKMSSGISSFVFAIGGAAGWDKDLIRKKAGLVLALSKLTFSYQFSRMILAEQLYRALSIINNLPYHKA